MNSPSKTHPESFLCATHQAVLHRTGKFTVRVASAARTVKLLAFGLGLAAVGLSSARAANTELDVIDGQTDLAQATTYTQGTAPTTTSDVNFNLATYTTTTYGLSANLGIGTLNDQSGTALTIANSSGAARTITLSGGGDTVSGSAAADLFYVATGSSLTLTGGTGVTALGLVLGTGGNFDVAGTANIGSIISGTGPLAKTGAGTLTLGGVNTFTGGLNINAGVVSVAANTALGGTTGTAGAVGINGGTLTTTAGITNTHAITIGAGGGTINVSAAGQIYNNTANTLLGSGALTVTGTSGTLAGQRANAGDFRVTQTNTYSGAITAQSGGIFEYGVANAVAAGATFTLGNEGEFVDVTGITASNAITVSGGTNSILSFANGTAGIISGAVTLNANAIVGLRDFYNTATVRGGTISGLVSGTGGLTVNSGTGTGGTLTLSNANSTYSGGTTLTGANLLVGANSTGAAGAVTTGPLGTGTLTLNGGNVNYTGAATKTISNAVVVGTNGGSLGGTTTAGYNLVVAGNITGSGALALSAAFNNSGVNLTGNNSGYTGTVTVTAGTANNRLSATTAGSANAAWVVNGILETDVVGGGTFNLGALSGGTAGLIDGHAVNAAAATSTLSVGALNTSTTYAGVIGTNTANTAATGNDVGTNNVLALTKVGTGTLTLSGANTYTGATTISGGMLSLTNSAANTQRLTATSTIAVNTGGTLLLSGTTASTDRINNAATVTLNGGTINTGGLSEGVATGAAAATTGLGALTLSSSSTLDFGAGHTGSSVLAFANSSGQTWSGTLTLTDFTAGTDFLNFASNTGLTSTQLAEITYSNGTSTFVGSGLDAFGDVTFSAAAVPEPSTWTAGLVMFGVVIYGQRRRFRAGGAAL